MKVKIPIIKRDPIAKDLRTPKYRMRVIVRKNTYKRKEKNGKNNDVYLV